MNSTSHDKVQPGSLPPRARRTRPWAGLLTAAVAAALNASGAHALSLGELQLQSHLGQPLRAELMLTLAAGEQVSSGCVRVRGAGGAPYDARVSLTGTGNVQRLGLQGRAPVREPLLELVIAISCPGTPAMERWYTLLPTPQAVAERRAPVSTTPAPAPAAARAPSPPAASSMPAQRAPAAPAPRAANAGAPASPLHAGDSYRVQPGDTLSAIAQRVQNRGGSSLWAQAGAILEANPQAFIDANPDRLRAGAVLSIPALQAGTRSAATGAPPSAVVSSRAPAPAAAAPSATTRPPQPRLLPVQVSAAVAAAAPLDVASVFRSVPATVATASLPAVNTAAANVTAAAPSAREPGLLRLIGGALVGVGLLSLAGLLAWTSLRRRREEDYEDAMVDTVVDAPARPQLAPPPSFDPRYREDSGIEVTVSEPAPFTADEFGGVDPVSPATDQGLDLDELFGEPHETHPAVDGPDAAGFVDLPAAPGFEAELADATAEADPAEPLPHLPDDGEAPAPAPGSRPGGDTTVEHQFAGFSETQAMQMLEQDYTSRLETARKLDDTGQLEATDTLHGLSNEVLQSLSELRADVGDDGEGTDHTAALSLDELQMPDSVSAELTALMQEPEHVAAADDLPAGQDEDGTREEAEETPTAAQGGR